jgi:hypothetical protein
MLDRFVSIEITADVNDYIEYSTRSQPNVDVLAYLAACPDMLLIVKKSADSTALTKSPTPRGWTQVQELLNNCKLNEKLLMELTAGILGPETAASFFGFLKNRNFKIPSTEKLLYDFEEVRPVVDDLLKKNRLDIMSLVIKKTVNSFKLTEINLKNLDAFIGCLPDELAVLFFKLLAIKRPEDFTGIAQHLECFDRVSDKMVDILMA